MAKWKDGYYDYSVVKNAMNQDFCSEKELCDYIENHMAEFCADCLGVDPEEFCREFPLNGRVRTRAASNRRLDFLIKTKCGKNIAVECKRPSNFAELSYAIGQSLAYITLFGMSQTKVDRFVIVSTKIDSVVPLIIDKFNLPIEFIVFDRDKYLTFQNGSTKRK